MTFFKPFEMPTGADIPQRQVSIVDFGAVEGGRHKNTDAIHQAMDALAAQGGGRIVFPAGKWLTGPIRMQSNIELHLEKGCEVLFSTDKEDYLPAVYTLYEGMRCYTWCAQLYAHQCHDIAVTGEGSFNGQGFVWWYIAAMTRAGIEDLHAAGEEHRPVEQRVYDTEEQGLRPGLLHFVDCRNVLIEGCTFKFSPFWTVHPTWCENLIVRDIRVVNPYDHAPNTDGCNLEGCKRALVDGVWADTGDDAVCLKAGRDEDGRVQARPCEDVILRRIVANRSHGGITIGSEMSSGVRNILVEDCDFQNSLIALWIKTAPERGGYVRDIEYHRIRTGRLRDYGICMTMGYYVDGNTPDENMHLPQVENILVDDFQCSNTATALLVEGHAQAPFRNICLKDCDLNGRTNMKVSHVDGLNMDNVHFH